MQALPHDGRICYATISETSSEGWETDGPGGRSPLFSSGSIERLSRFLKANLLFVSLFLFGAVVRVAVSFAYQPALLLQRDTYAYLQQALEPAPGGFRPALYPLILKGLLVFDNLVVVTVIQHLAGLGIGLLLYLLLRRVGVGASLAAVGSAPILLDAYQIDIEHFVLTEAFFESFIVVALALIMWNKRPSIPSAAVAGILLAFSGLTRFVGVGLIAPALLYVLIRRMGWLRGAALVVGFALPLVVHASWSGVGGEGLGLTNRNGYFLYGRVASFADCTGMQLREEIRRFCFETPPSERGPNYGFFTLDVPRFEDERQGNALLLEFSTTMIRRQPLDYARAVATDLLRFFDPSAPIEREPFVKRWRFVSSLEEADPHPFVVRRGGSPPRISGVDQEFRIDRPLANKLLAYQDVFYVYGPLLALMLVLGTIGSLVGAPIRGGDLRAECALLTLSALALLLPPVMATVYHFRYTIPALALAGPAGALGAAVLWARYSDMRAARSEPRQEP